jgi:hypothetical protein
MHTMASVDQAVHTSGENHNIAAEDVKSERQSGKQNEKRGEETGARNAALGKGAAGTEEPEESGELGEPEEVDARPTQNASCMMCRN